MVIHIPKKKKHVVSFNSFYSNKEILLKYFFLPFILTEKLYHGQQRIFFRFDFIFWMNL